jgi:hypothetical protein
VAVSKNSDPETKSSGDAAVLTGKVNTTSGGPIAGATVWLENLGTHRRETAQSTGEGVFNFAGLPAGEYRNRTHYFVDYEGFRLVQGRAPVKLTVPTVYEHSHPGDFTDVGGPLVTNFDPVGLHYFRLYPMPNVPGSNNQFVSAPSGTNFSQIGDLRIDQRLSERDQFFSRFSYNRTLVYIPGQFPAVEEAGMTIQPGGSLSSLAGNMYDAGVNTVLGWKHDFRSDLSLDLRAGYIFWNEADTSLNPNVAVNQGFLF